MGDVSLTPYEQAQLAAIFAWKREAPSVTSRAFALLASPVVWLTQKIVSDATLRSALLGANAIAIRLSDRTDILREGNVGAVAELKTGFLERSDELASVVHTWAVGLAAVEGGTVGAAGLPGLAIDIPATVVLALRTVHKIGLCYGYECLAERDQNFILGILAASGANSLEEKHAALAVLTSSHAALTEENSTDAVERAAADAASRGTNIIAIKQLAKQLGVNLTKRKALQAIPGIGAAIGAGVNGSYIRDIGWAARRAFQERWLLDNGRFSTEVA